MKNNYRLLLVDDDKEICDLIKTFLAAQGYQVFVAHDYWQMQTALRQHQIDLLILDIMLPRTDGLEICKKLREKSSLPIIVISAMGQEADRILGLEIGADDYLPKPFSPHELLARIKALLRRANNSFQPGKNILPTLPQIKFLDWHLERNKRHLIAHDGLTIPLSAGEYELLATFIQYAGRTLTRDQLLELTQNRAAAPFDRSIDVQVGRLRKKIEDDPKNPQIIITVRGGGYQFTPQPETISVTP